MVSKDGRGRVRDSRARNPIVVLTEAQETEALGEAEDVSVSLQLSPDGGERWRKGKSGKASR